MHAVTRGAVAFTTVREMRIGREAFGPLSYSLVRLVAAQARGFGGWHARRLGVTGLARQLRVRARNRHGGGRQRDGQTQGRGHKELRDCHR